MNNISNVFYKISVGLLFLITQIVIVTSIFFLLGISINILNTIIPIILLVSYIFYTEDTNKKAILILAGILIIISICIVYSGQVYDNTWDGSAYHKQAVGLLKEGWNPIFQSSMDYNSISSSISVGGENPLLWAETYPKATWYFASTIYYITNNIEAGKCYTLLFSFIMFGILFEYLMKLHYKCIFSVLISSLASFNPIVCAQFQSYYLDGLAICVLGLIMLISVKIVNGTKENIKENYFILFSLIIWGCNLKFSILLFTITYIGVLYIYTCVLERKINIKRFLILLGMGGFSVLVVGFAPYMTNLIRYNDIFYGFSNMIGATNWGEEIGVSGLNNIERFWMSLFGRMSHGNYHSLQEILKIPFTFNKEELIYYSIVDTRIGGFGIFFSGLFLISLIIIILYIVKSIKIKDISNANFLIGIFFIITIIEVMFLPATHTARYVGHIFFFVLWSFTIVYHENKKKFISYALILISILNILPWCQVSYRRLIESNATTAILKELGKQSEEDNKIFSIAFYAYDFNGIQYNLKDFNIRYKYIPLEEIGDNYKTTYYNWIYYK